MLVMTILLSRQCVICLLTCQLQGIQFLFCFTNNMGQKFLLLDHQIRVAEVQLQEPVPILKLTLRIPDSLFIITTEPVDIA